VAAVFLLCKEPVMQEVFQVFAVGVVRQTGKRPAIEIFDPFQDALLGLDGFSHVDVLYWLHENDTPEMRKTLRVHPRKNPANPVTGVFATHSPRRPNLIALTRCKIAAVGPGTVAVDAIDAKDGSPVLDLKCVIPEALRLSDVRVPDWVRHGR
jgi:tRNA-Thr(GGU) m(6)t(6)A37 methyltransferase TsaA